MKTDDLWPRDLAHRYRVYTLRGEDLHVICACPEPGGIGNAIVAFHDDQKRVGRTLGDLGRLGVMDVCPNGEPSETGEWVINPFDWGGHI